MGLATLLSLAVVPASFGNEPRSPQPDPLADVDPTARRHYEAGLAHAHRGQYERAIAEFNTAIRLAPDFAAAFQDRGSSYLELQNPIAAMADFNRAIRLTPNHSNAYYNRGNLHLRQEQYFLAIADYDQAIQLNPSDAAAWQNRALSHAITGNLAQAVNGFQQAARLYQQQNNPDAYQQVIAILEYFQPDLDIQATPTPNSPATP